MILNASLFGTLTDVSKPNELSNGVILWPSKRKAIKLSPDFNIKDFYFSVITQEELTDLKIIINDFEILDLRFHSNQGEHFEYRSDRYSSKTFLGFNLGIMELYLETPFNNYPLTTLNNKDNKFASEHLNYMYESVASSGLFALFMADFRRANIAAKESLASPGRYFWLTISNANLLMKELKRFINGELIFTSKISNISGVSRYNSQSILHEVDIEWLIDNPSELIPSDDGMINLYGLNYQIENISQSILKRDFDTYENRLLLSSLYSIRSVLTEFLNENKDTKLFPHKSVINIIEEADEILTSLNRTLKINPPFNTIPEFSNKYLDDVRYIKLFQLITNWYKNSRLTIGNDLRSPILGITEIFEHFCLIKIVDCLKKQGFILKEVEYKSAYEANYILLIRDQEEISLYYEPFIDVDSIYPLTTSKLTSYYRPDYTLIYRDRDLLRCGVIDAKFSDAEGIKKLADDIYAKYAIYLHRPDNNQPIDYVWAIYPSKDSEASINFSRNEKYRDLVSPSLGYFSIPLEEDGDEKITNFLINLITTKKPNYPFKSIEIASQI